MKKYLIASFWRLIIVAKKSGLGSILYNFFAITVGPKQLDLDALLFEVLTKIGPTI